MSSNPNHAALQGARTASLAVSSDEPYNDDDSEYLKAVDRYRRDTGRHFPTATEYLAVARSLGYRRVYRAGDTAPRAGPPPASGEADGDPITTRRPPPWEPGGAIRCGLKKRENGCESCEASAASRGHGQPRLNIDRRPR